MNIVIHAWRDLANPQAGGSEVLVDQLIRGLLSRDHRVTLITGGPVGPREYPVIDAGGTYTQYLRNPLVDREFLADADVVVDVANGMAACSPLWWRGPTVLIVNHVHVEQWALTFPRPVAALGRMLEARVIPRVYRSSLVATISQSTAQDIQELGFAERSIRVMPLNPIDALASTVEKAEEPQFLILGRMVPHKRIDLAIRAWEEVRPRTGGRLLIAGDGPDRGRLENLAGMDVEFLGRVDAQRKADLLTGSWLLVHPALHEGWGIVITEAAKAGTPALGFAVPGVRDSVADGMSGVLVESYEQFVAEWIDIAVDPSRRDRLAEGAREYGKSFTAEATIDIFESTLGEAYESRNPPRGLGRGQRT